MKKAFIFLLILLGGGLIGWVVSKLSGGGLNPDTGAGASTDDYKTWVLLTTPLLYILVAGTHELGHVLAGKLQKFHFFGLIIGPFAWKPGAEGKIRFHWNKSLQLAGGLAIMLPDESTGLRRRFMWYAAGGPLASLLLFVLVFGLSQLLPPASFAYALAEMTYLMSGGILVATILPIRAGGFASDGQRILTFARNGPTAEADLAGLRAIAHLRAGRPHAEFPAEEFEKAVSNKEIPAQQRVTIDYYRYLHALAVGETDRAAELYAGVMDHLDVFPKGAHGNFYLEQALFEAQYRQDLPAAEAALAKNTPSQLTEALTLHLAEAAIANLRGDREALSLLLPAINAALPTSMDQGRVPIIKDWLNHWKKLTDLPA